MTRMEEEVLQVIDNSVIYVEKNKKRFLIISSGGRPDFCIGIVYGLDLVSLFSFNGQFMTANENKPKMSDMGPITGRIFSVKMSLQSAPYELRVCDADGQEVTKFQKWSKDIFLAAIKQMEKTNAN